MVSSQAEWFGIDSSCSCALKWNWSGCVSVVSKNALLPVPFINSGPPELHGVVRTSTDTGRLMLYWAFRRGSSCTSLGSLGGSWRRAE
ncbi:hypothetical protein WG66_013435 [Moniliophthora roreri]|nr:hypothetical protein WG66_013435 [Moniliophthora roreri]